MSLSSSLLSQTKFLNVENIKSIIKVLGLKQIFLDVKNEIKKDYLRWNEFDKCSRTANHNLLGVIELMPISNDSFYTFKYVNGHPKNYKINLPTIMAFSGLADMKTGFPLLISESTILTAIRTACTSVLAAEIMMNENSKSMAVIGNGSQSEFQILAFYYLLGINTFYLFDIDKKATLKLINNLKNYNVQLIQCSSTEEATSKADIITTITADKNNNIIIDHKMIHNGQHINAVGGDCPGKTELAPTVLLSAMNNIIVEYENQSRIEGEIQQMPNYFPVIELYKVLEEYEKTGKKFRKFEQDITIFDSVGFALEDFSILNYIYTKSNELNIGENIQIIPQFNDTKDLYSLLEI